MTLLEKIKYALKCKVSITIVTPPPAGVTISTRPRVVEKDSPFVARRKHSNVRFKQQQEENADGTPGKIYYFTELWDGNRWAFVSGSFNADKNAAMDAHLKVIEGQSVEKEKVETILWEGLSKEETVTWVEMNRTNE